MKAYYLLALTLLVCTNVFGGKLQDEVERARDALDEQDKVRELKREEVKQSAHNLIASTLQSEFRVYESIMSGEVKGYSIDDSPTADMGLGLPDWEVTDMPTRSIAGWGVGVFGVFARSYLVSIDDVSDEFYEKVRAIDGEKYMPRTRLPKFRVMGKVTSDGSIFYIDKRVLMEFGDWDETFPDMSERKEFFVKFEDQRVKSTTYRGVPYQAVLFNFFERIVDIKEQIGSGVVSQAIDKFLRDHRVECGKAVSVVFWNNDWYQSSEDAKSRLFQKYCF